MRPSRRIWLSGILGPGEWEVMRGAPGEEVVAEDPAQAEAVEAQDPAARTQSAQVPSSPACMIAEDCCIGGFRSSCVLTTAKLGGVCVCNILSLFHQCSRTLTVTPTPCWRVKVIWVETPMPARAWAAMTAVAVPAVAATTRSPV